MCICNVNLANQKTVRFKYVQNLPVVYKNQTDNVMTFFYISMIYRILYTGC